MLLLVAKGEHVELINAYLSCLNRPSPSSKQFALRKNMSETEETLNSHLKLRTEPPRAGSDYRSTINLVAAVKPYRYMFEKITDKGEGMRMDYRLLWLWVRKIRISDLLALPLSVIDILCSS
jgi:hypothetical protein